MKPRRKITILVVDDEANVAKTLAMVLKQEGYAAVPAPSAKAALELASSTAIDIAIIDVMLRDSDGIQTAVELCKRIPHCKILLMSGDSESAPLLEAAKKDGIHFDVLAKPIPPVELFSKLDFLVAKGSRQQNGQYATRRNPARLREKNS